MDQARARGGYRQGGGRGSSGQGGQRPSQIAAKINGMASLGEWNATNLVTDGEDVAGRLKGQDMPIKTQLYKILSLIKRQQRNFKRGGFDKEQVVLLKVPLAWAAYKHQKKLGELFQVLKSAIEKVHDERDYQKLVSFIEAVVAYNALGKIT